MPTVDSVAARMSFFASQDLGLLLRDLAPLVCLDIGARGGVTDDLLPLVSAAEVYGFEPDEEECARLNRNAGQSDHPYRSVRFLPVGLGQRREIRSLNMTRHRGASSLLAPDPCMRAAFPSQRKYFDVDHQADIPTEPLDEVAERYGFDNAVYIKLDVEGFELEVLRAAEKLLTSALLAIRIEVAFVPSRIDQPDYGDIASFLKHFNFMPMSFSHMASWRSLTQVKHPRKATGPIPYSRGQIIHGDVVFLRRPDAIDHSSESGIRQLLTLALLALLYDFVDFAHDIFERDPVARYLAEHYAFDPKRALRDVSLHLARRHDKAAVRQWLLLLRKRITSEARYALGR